MERRLLHLGDRWLPPDAEPLTADDVWAEPGTRVMLGPWSRPALRGLALLVALLVAIAAYLLWQARPSEVVAAPAPPSAGSEARDVATPEVLATGVPLTGVPGPASAEVGEPVGAAESAPPIGAEEPSTAEAEVVVHVAGLVNRPGLVRLPAGSRIADALEAAGGVTRKRAADSVNLARILVDGEQILVADAPLTAAGSTTPGTEPAGTAARPPVVIDLNAATVEMLDDLPGVGPVLAGRIVAWRTTHGRFRTVDELGEVSGIGDSILAQLRPLVRV